MPVEIKYAQDAREIVAKGVEAVAKAVRTTLGPKGRTVILNKENGQVRSTKDGVTVANHVKSPFNIEQVGIKIIQEAANNSNKEAGDGTTTTTVLASETIKSALDYVKSNPNASLVDLQRGILKAKDRAIEILKTLVKVIDNKDQLKHIATISANGDETIGEVVSEAVWGAGRDGYVTIEESPYYKTYSSVIDGMRIKKTMVSPVFASQSDGRAILENPLIMIWNGKLPNLSAPESAPFVGILSQLKREGRPLLLITSETTGETIASLAQNNYAYTQNNAVGMQCCVIEAPSNGALRKEILEDISAYTGATALSPEKGHTLDIDLVDFGQAERVIVDATKTVIIGKQEFKTVAEQRKESLKELLEQETDQQQKEFLRERISRLDGKVSQVYIGNTTGVEFNEIKDRVVDSVSAAQAAFSEGFVEGGGYTLKTIWNKMDLSDLKDDELNGGLFFRDSLLKPNYYILDNAGLPVTDQKVNAKTGKVCDLYEEGIIDPAKVVRVSLESAASVSATTLMTECIIHEQGYQVS